MWESIVEMATESGIWATMFIVLFYKQIKESKTREESYQSTIDKLADKLQMIAEIKTDIQEIKDVLSNKTTGKETDIKSNEQKTE